MRVQTKNIENPIGHICKIREYGRHFRFQIDWNSMSSYDKKAIKQAYRADASRLYISLIIPVIDNLLSLDKCRLHISEFNMLPSFDAIQRVDNYIDKYGLLPDYCGIDIQLSAEEKVNLMCLI